MTRNAAWLTVAVVVAVLLWRMGEPTHAVGSVGTAPAAEEYVPFSEREIEDDPTVLDGPRLTGVEGWRADLEILRAAIPRFFSYVDHRRELCGVDVDALIDGELAALGDEATKVGFLAAITRVVAGLHDGHAHARLDGVTLQGPRRWPVHLMDSPQGVFVLGTLPEHRQSGALVPGDVVTAVDGESIEQLIAQQQLVTNASSDAARRVIALHSLPRSSKAERVRFTIVRDGKTRDVELPCVPADTIIGAPMRLYGEQFVDLEFAPGVAFWRPGPFSPTADHREFMDQDQAGREALTQARRDSYAKTGAALAGHRAVIIDLRGNPGGTDMLGQVFASQFVEPGTVYFKLSMKAPSGEWLRESTHTVPELSGRAPFTGQVVLVVDERTFSTADNVAACLVDTREDVTVVGRHAGSGTGAPRAITLPHSGAEVTFCTMRVRTAKDRMTEGQGVVPDVPVAWTIADWLDDSRDPDLDAALAAVR